MAIHPRVILSWRVALASPVVTLRGALVVRRLTLLIVGLLILIPLGGAQAVGSETRCCTTGGNFFGTTVEAGGTAASIDMGNSLTLKNVSIRSLTKSNGGQTITATGSLLIGTDSNPLSVTVTYSNALASDGRVTTGSWSIVIAEGSARSSYSPPAGSGVNLNNVSGTLSGQLTMGNVSHGSLAASLAISGVSYGGATYSGTASVSASGLQATIAISDITLPGGKVCGSLNITASSTSSAVSASVTFGSSGGMVSADLSYTDTKNWSVTLAGNGAISAAVGAPIDFNNLSGTIAKKKGALSFALSVTGVTVGSATFDASLSASSAGLTASATVNNLVLSPEYTFETASITVSTATNTASVSGQLVAGTSTVTASASYQDSNDWSIAIATNGAPSAYAATSLDLNDLSGSVTDANGRITASLQVSGVVVGNGTFDMTATVTPTSVEASVVADNVVVGGITLNSASITVSTSEQYADITASIETDAGTFDGDLTVAVGGGGGYLSISLDGAELKAGGTDFYLQSFGFSWSGNVPASGCSTMTASMSGVVVMKAYTLNLEKTSMTLSCNTLQQFTFQAAVTHTPTFEGAMTKTLYLRVDYFSAAGTYVGGTWDDATQTYTDATWTTCGSTCFYQQSFGPDQDKGNSYSYNQGFFGIVDLSQTKSFSHDYDDWKGDSKNFSKTVTLGIGFGVAVYQPPVTASSSNPAWTYDVNMMGYFEADRVSGDITCDIVPNDFTCGGNIKINPSWAGKYDYSWTGL